jgi:hypothetical protein
VSSIVPENTVDYILIFKKAKIPPELADFFCGIESIVGIPLWEKQQKIKHRPTPQHLVRTSEPADNSDDPASRRHRNRHGTPL